MSERDLFIKAIPQIAEMIVEIQKMPRERYEEWKSEWLAECERTVPRTLNFVKKILVVIDTYLEEQQA